MNSSNNLRGDFSMRKIVNINDEWFFTKKQLKDNCNYKMAYRYTKSERLFRRISCRLSRKGMGDFQRKTLSMGNLLNDPMVQMIKELPAEMMLSFAGDKLPKGTGTKINKSLTGIIKI